MADIFLSYARENHEQARMLAEILASFGWTVFWDREILAGAVFDDVIQEQLDHAKCVVCLWSVDSVSSQWVRAEAEEGANRNMLVSVLIDDVRLPIAFRRIQAAKLLNWAGSKDDEQLKDVLRAVKFVVEKPPQVNQPGTGAPTDPPGAKPRSSSSAKATPLPTSVPTPPLWKQTRYVAPFVAMLIMAAAVAGYFWLKPHASLTSAPTTTENTAVTTNMTPSVTDQTPVEKPHTADNKSRRKTAILAGNPFLVLFDRLPDHVGVIKPEGQYEVQFLPKTLVRRASGPVYGGGDQSHDDPSFSVCEPEKNGFCIWGAAFRFDESGRVFFVAGGDDPGIQNRLQGRQIGRIRSLKTEISGGKPFVVLLDQLPDHIGTIKPQGRYNVQFLPQTLVWRASGPVFGGGDQSHDDPAVSTCEPGKNEFCVWGASFRFDEAGRVFFVAGGYDPGIQVRLQGQRVGRIIG